MKGRSLIGSFGLRGLLLTEGGTCEQLFSGATSVYLPEVRGQHRPEQTELKTLPTSGIAERARVTSSCEGKEFTHYCYNFVMNTHSTMNDHILTGMKSDK